jgi:SAM-dependent methyltransferase
MANSLLEGNCHVKVLEAGCGSASHVRFPSAVHIVGIDISKEQLEKNTEVQEKILGDIQEYMLPTEQFDVAVCWMVLEHLSKPKDALLNMFQSLKPGGLLVVAIPNLLSFKGIITKVTPFWFHILFYRFMKYKSRPFPTFLRVAIVPKKMMRLAEDHGFSVVCCRFAEGDATKKLRARYRLVEMLFATVNSFVHYVSLGRAQSLLLDNCFLIFRKTAKITL